MNVNGTSQPTDDKLTLEVQLMVECCQATCHYPCYLSQRWPRSMLPYGTARPQWVKNNFYFLFICLRHWSWDKMAAILQVTFSNNMPALLQLMAWQQSNNKPLFEPMMASIYKWHLYFETRGWMHQWVPPVRKCLHNMDGWMDQCKTVVSPVY